MMLDDWMLCRIQYDENGIGNFFIWRIGQSKSEFLFLQCNTACTQQAKTYRKYQ